jgi:hypothetical protein
MRMSKLKKNILVITYIVFFAQQLYAGQNFTSADKRISEKVKEEIIIEPPQSRLPENECLNYTVRWLGIPVGHITASIKGIKILNNRKAYLLEVIAKTNAFCSVIYKVDDRFLSYMDVKGLHTLRHEVYRREGRYKKDAVTDFNQITHRAYFKNLLDGSEKEFDIPPNAQDTLSACYYFRLLPVEIGKRIEYAVCNNESIYQLFGAIKSKDFIKIPGLGKRATFYMQPYAKLKDKKVRKGRVSGYFSVDSKRLPLLAVVQASMFTEVTASLSKIEYGQRLE